MSLHQERSRQQKSQRDKLRHKPLLIAAFLPPQVRTPVRIQMPRCSIESARPQVSLAASPPPTRSPPESPLRRASQIPSVSAPSPKCRLTKRAGSSPTGFESHAGATACKRPSPPHRARRATAGALPRPRRLGALPDFIQRRSRQSPRRRPPAAPAAASSDVCRVAHDMLQQPAAAAAAVNTPPSYRPPCPPPPARPHPGGDRGPDSRPAPRPGRE